MAQKPDRIQDIFDSLDTEIRDLFNQLLDSNGEVNKTIHLNKKDIKNFMINGLSVSLKN